MAGEQLPSPNPIAGLNDAFRRTTVDDIFITQGVQALPDVLGLVQAVCDFDTFTPDNNPFREHDIGSIVWYEAKTFWKIDYYGQELVYGENPLSPESRKVMTVMLAEEY